jgi:hypothetical protein
MRLSHPQEHWDRGPVELNWTEERDTTGWNTRLVFPPAVWRAARKFQIFLASFLYLSDGGIFDRQLPTAE